MFELFNPVMKASGPCPAKIMIVGEAPGETEEMIGLPFVGSSGQELTQMLFEAGIERKECYLTNVFWSRPQGNKIELFLVSKAETVGAVAAIAAAGLPPSISSLPAIDKGKYLNPVLYPELSRLKAEIEAVKPNLIIALGNKACWALLGTTGITAIRGVAAECILVPGVKVLPTFHPAAIMRNWGNRVIVIQDLIKAKREAEFPDIRRPQRIVTINPSIEQVEAFETEACAAPLLAIDTETKNRQITMCGFATSPSRAFVIPFVDETKPENSYWPSLEEEIRAFRVMRRILLFPGIKHVFQNGLYDIQYFWRIGIPVMIDEDTMLLHHSLFPEMLKGLGFLGSVYTNEASWKLLRTRSEDEMNKRDE